MTNIEKQQEILNKLTDKEKALALNILKQYSKEGNSKLFNDLIYQDYEEIPVDIETFLTDPKYLGKGLVNEEGKFTVFPYWVETLKKLFPTNVDTAYNTLVLTGAIGLGKSFVAVIAMLYLLYRMLCLKDPYLHYGLQPIDKITFSLINITLDAAKGVAWDKLQQLVQSSEWFLAHGNLKGTSNIQWQPFKGIELIVGSRNNHVIGRAVFCNFTDECLAGDTLVLTEHGYRKIEELAKEQTLTRFITVNPNTLSPEYSQPCYVQETTSTDTYYEIELEDNTIIKCTPTHKFLLKDGTYKYVKDLLETDTLANPTLINSNIDNTYIIYKVNVNVKKITQHNSNESKPYYDVVNCMPYNNFIIKTNTSNIISHNCNFGIGNDIEKLKKKQKTLISQVDARMQSRFMKGTKLPTLQIIASSKRSEQSFLETYIETKKKTENKTTLIIDEPQWVIRNDKDSPEKFYVAIGNKFLASEVLNKNITEEEANEYRQKGYTLLKVPIGYYQNFLEDVDTALTDIAGISTVNSMKFISGIRWNDIKTTTYKNPFIKDIISCGNAPNDKSQYKDYFDMSTIDKSYLSKPLFIHLDMSTSGDKTGIAGVWIKGKIANSDDSSKDLFYRVAFSVSIEAPKGYQISFEKNRNFIKWLRDQGFNIKGITTDTFQSANLQQNLQADGFDVSILSVDRLQNLDKQIVSSGTDSSQRAPSKVCIPYQYFKTTVYERRLEVYTKCDLLTDEVLGLEREADGHINHPENGAYGSKDQIDAVVGSLYNASLHFEEYNYDYSESLNLMFEANEDTTANQMNQLSINLEEELNKLNPFYEKHKNSQEEDDNNTFNPYTDFMIY